MAAPWDNGREFINKLMEKLMAKLKVAHTTTPSYNPQSNNVEQFHRTLRTHYRMWTPRHSIDWTKQLPALELAYNSKVNDSTGLNPFLAFLGLEAKLPADMVMPNRHEEYSEEIDAVTACLRRMSKIYDYLKDKEDAKVHRNSLRYANQPALQVGGVVWYLSSRNVVSKPLQVTKSWTGMGGGTKGSAGSVQDLAI